MGCHGLFVLCVSPHKALVAELTLLLLHGARLGSTVPVAVCVLHGLPHHMLYVCVTGFVVAETSDRVRRGVDNGYHVAVRVVLVLHPLLFGLWAISSVGMPWQALRAPSACMLLYMCVAEFCT